MLQAVEVTRLSRHVRKKIKVSIRGLRPSSIVGRFRGPQVLLNSIPKAGTHLLEQALKMYPLLRNAGKKTLTASNSLDELTLNRVMGIKRGQFLNAHLQAHTKLLEVLRCSDIKILLMIRDPRDVAVSRVNYVMNIDRSHRAYRYFNSLKDDASRLMASIEGVDSVLLSIGKVFSRFVKWLDEENVLVCRFEDLIGKEGGGSEERQINTLIMIARHLDIELSDEKIRRIANNTYSPGSSTFYRGKIGGWRKRFTEKHRLRFMETAGEMLTLYGYDFDDK